MESTQKEKLLKALTLLGFALTFVAVVFGFVGMKQYSFIGRDVPAMNTISVSGEGETFATADIAEFTFSVTKEAVAVKHAQDDVTAIIDDALALLKSKGVEEKDIKTVSYNVYPRYEYNRIVCITTPCPTGERELQGFEVSQTIRVKVRQTDIAGEILGGLGETGVTNVSGLTFSIDDEDALRREARKAAIADAQAKAEILAKDLGVKLGRIVYFNENDGSFPRAFMDHAVMESSMMGYGGDAKSTPSLPQGENTVRSNVNITYELR